MYIKISPVTTPGSEQPAALLFYYHRDTVFNDVSLLSNQMSKNIRTKDGASMTEDYAISEDERNVVDVCIRSVLPDICEPMLKITSAVSPAFDGNVSEDGRRTGIGPGGTEASIPEGPYVEFRIRDNGAYNDNAISIADACIYNALKYGTLKEYYSASVHPDLLKLCASRFDAEVAKLERRLFQLKKKSVVY